jgi:hypothetical protein
MDEVSSGLDFVYVYIDDILIASTNAPKSIYDYFSTVFDSMVLLSTQLNPFLVFHFSSSLDTKLVHTVSNLSTRMSKPSVIFHSLLRSPNFENSLSLWISTANSSPNVLTSKRLRQENK